MKMHPIDAKTHGILDYAISGILLAAPSVLGLRGGARNIALLSGATEAIVNTLSDHSVAASRKIGLKTHRKMDLLTLGGMAIMSVATGVWKNPKARIFFLAVLAFNVANVVLTDWEEEG